MPRNVPMTGAAIRARLQKSAAARRALIDGGYPDDHIGRLYDDLATLPAYHRGAHEFPTVKEQQQENKRVSAALRKASAVLAASAYGNCLSVLDVGDGKIELLRAKCSNRPSAVELIETIADDIAERPPLTRSTVRRMKLETWVILGCLQMLDNAWPSSPSAPSRPRKGMNACAAMLASIILSKKITANAVTQANKSGRRKYYRE
ncbi:MAG: hypothetical protein QG616_664 [Pseudomonadota bacterium]|nr:hypothetical protein [Pseudomonadota bacterium]MDQ5942581.1 hypothetical protein [Pseudomonadota bacterium]